jgi:hypothetical protein
MFTMMHFPLFSWLPYHPYAVTVSESLESEDAGRGVDRISAFARVLVATLLPVVRRDDSEAHVCVALARALEVKSKRLTLIHWHVTLIIRVDQLEKKFVCLFVFIKDSWNLTNLIKHTGCCPVFSFVQMTNM